MEKIDFDPAFGNVIKNFLTRTCFVAIDLTIIPSSYAAIITGKNRFFGN
jgi:hypothetical protein